jgi:hypothetical protein
MNAEGEPREEAAEQAVQNSARNTADAPAPEANQPALPVQEIPTLDYRTPPQADAQELSEYSVRHFIAGFLGILLGLMGLPFLLAAIFAFIEATRGWNRFVRNYASDAVVALVFGLVCIGVAVRWLRFAIRGR